MSSLQRKKRRRLIIPRGSLFLPGDAYARGDSYASLAKLDFGSHARRHAAALAIALGLHAIAALAVLFQRGEKPAAPRAVRREIAASIVRAPPHPTPPPPRPPPHIAARAPDRSATRAPPKPAPPARAGRAIALEGPADLTSFDLVVGQGNSYAGGSSSANGTNRTAVHETAQINAPPRASQPGAPDLSRAPGPLRRDWSCAWPDEAQDSDLRDARVTLRVHVSREGEPAAIDIIASPPGGFAEAARRCAEGERYRTALDKSGQPIDAPTPLFNVHFLR